MARVRAPRSVVVATAAFGLLVAGWSVLTPLAEAPDEPAHLGLVLFVADTGHYPRYDRLHQTVGLRQLCVDYATSTNPCHTPAERADHVRTRARPAEAAPPKHHRAHAGDVAFRTPEPGRMNQMPQHPPLYYAAMAGALRLERAVVPGRWSIDTELAYLRLLNALLVTPLPWLAWLLARRLGLGDTVGTVAALVPLAVPQLTHIGGTVNNDNLFVVLVAALMALLAGVARGDASRRTAVLVGVVTGLALLTKGFAVVLPPLVVLAYLLGSRRRLLAPVGALAVAFVVAGWWYVRNLAVTGKLMPSTEDRRLSATHRPAGFHPHVATYARSAFDRLVDGFWGQFGWREVSLPTALAVAATLLALAAVLAAFRRPTPASPTPPSADASANGSATPRDDGGAGRAVLAFLLVPVGLLAAFVLVRSAVIYRDSGRLAFQQGRYLFGGLTAVAVVLAVGAVRTLGRRAVPVAFLAAAGMQAFAVLWVLDGWWGADGFPLGALRAVVAWSGWPDPIAVAVLAAGPAGLVALAVAVRRSASQIAAVSVAEPPKLPQFTSLRR
jgi:4-amino-4-deoxy-L-arabinose transferase-like glycosyltransferase